MDKFVNPQVTNLKHNTLSPPDGALLFYVWTRNADLDIGEWKLDEGRQSKWEIFQAKRPERCERNLRKPLVIVSLQTGTNIAISLDFQLKAMDNKMIDELSQLKGALCFSCTMT